MVDARPGEVTKLADATQSQDPEVGLAAVAALRGLVETLEALQVDNARSKGWTWKTIARPVGCDQAGCAQEVREWVAVSAGTVGGRDDRTVPDAGTRGVRAGR